MTPLHLKFYILCLMVYGLELHRRIRRRVKLLREAIVQPQQSAWTKLYNSQHSKSFLDITGMNYEAFNLLAALLDPPSKRGRPGLLDRNGQLGLLLLYLNSRMVLKHLCVMFGIVPSSCSDYLDKTMENVIRVLCRHPQAQIKFPSVEEMRRLALMVKGRDPHVSNVIGFIDGLSLATKCSSIPEIQNAFYNGYHSDTTINNVFCFSPEGKVIYCSLNNPGSYHDTKCCAKFIGEYEDKMHGFKICADQGFPLSSDRFCGPMSDIQINNLHPLLKDVKIQESNRYVSLRQAAEWGMRALQGSFSRLNCRLPSDMVKRKDILLSIVLLHNFRTELVGYNQIKTVFADGYTGLIQPGNYDRIRKYYKYRQDE